MKQMHTPPPASYSAAGPFSLEAGRMGAPSPTPELGCGVPHGQPASVATAATGPARAASRGSW